MGLEVESVLICRLRVLIPWIVSEKMGILTARLMEAKVIPWMISWMVSGWRESRENRRKRRKVMA